KREKFLWLFLSPFSAPGWVRSQVLLQETGPGAAKPGESRTLTCTISGDCIATVSAAWHWLRQPAGKGLEWVGRTWYRSGQWNTEYNSALRGRATLPADTARNQVSLQLRALTAADTGTYYCARQPHSHSDTEQR
uniref:Ig-like domain-containing protein n=1 Tax=Pelodiscus sinensis TaxID=13735 RepID=K7FXA8_PELSI